MSAPAILLINPRMVRRRNARMPLSLLHLAAVVDGQRPWKILDGNFVRDLVAEALATLRDRPHALVGVTVMPGPQVAPAIAISRAIREAAPDVPIVWGGYFPTLYPDAAINAPYVDVIVRGQGEQPLLDLLSCGAQGESALAAIRGITWKRGAEVVHNPDAPILAPETLPAASVRRPRRRPALHARRASSGPAPPSIRRRCGCRYRCSFCGVVSMWNGRTLLDAPSRMVAAGRELRDRWGADSLQLFDHNFFDREETSLPMIDALEALRMPWWCYARADTLAGFAGSTWDKLRRSRLKMVYVGAESGSDAALAADEEGQPRRAHRGARAALPRARHRPRALVHARWAPTTRG